jgi:hypothetical protein
LNYVKNNYVTNTNLNNTVTVITQNSISTATISGNQIYGGTISGVTINGAIVYADDKMYIGRQGISIFNTVDKQRVLYFNDTYGATAAISYEERPKGSGQYSLVARSDRNMILWAKGDLKLHNHPSQIKFAKDGLSTDGAASQYFSMQDILDALSALGRPVF